MTVLAKNNYLTLLLCMVLIACGKSTTNEIDDDLARTGEISTISSVNVDDNAEDMTLINIQGSGQLNPNVFKLTDPLRVIVDFTDTQLGDITGPIAVNNGTINEITLSQFDDVTSSLTRVVIGFDTTVDYDVVPQDNSLTIKVRKSTGIVSSTGATTVDGQFVEGNFDFPSANAGILADNYIDNEFAFIAALPVEEIAQPADTIDNITYNTKGDTTFVSVKANGAIDNYEDFMISNPSRLVLDLKGLNASQSTKNTIAVGDGIVDRIRLGKHTNKTRLVFDFATGNAPSYRISKMTAGLNIVVSTSTSSLNSFQEPMAIASEPVVPVASEEIVGIAEFPFEVIPTDAGTVVANAEIADQPVNIDATESLFAESPAIIEEQPLATAPTAMPASIQPYQVSSIDFLQTAGASRIAIGTTNQAQYTSTEDGSDTVIVNLVNASIGKGTSRPINASGFDSPVVTVVPKQIGGTTRIVTTLREAVPYTITQEGNMLYIDFSRGKSFKTATDEMVAETSTVPKASMPVDDEEIDAVVAAPAAKPKEDDPTVDLDEDDAFFETPEEIEPAKKYEYVKEELLSDAINAKGGSASTYGSDDLIFELDATPNKKYTGRRINLDFKDADIRALFRLFADISKLNIIVGDDVNGKVTIRLQDVPWDQAFAILLQTQSLGAIKYGNIIRVAPAQKIQKERELHAQAKKAAIAAAPIDTLFKAVSYANASNVANHVKNTLSERGTVDIDERTNTLIVRDVREKLTQAKTLIEKLDAQTPQVTIEARIVEATDSFVRNWGVQWGASAEFSAATGNPTGVLFPSNVSAVGGVGGTIAGGSNPILLNFPPTGSNSALALNLGSINNVLDLDLLLGYEEREGNAKLISSPKVTVLDNKPATILSGTKIPFITQTGNSGSNVRFESAVIQITVTPHITADGAVIMQVTATRNEPDFGQAVLGNPSIIQREATTEVLVKSGNTTVIGGIYRVNRTREQAGFPVLRKIPILGWFFSSDNRRLDREELLIFITPRIVGDERTAIRQVQG